MVDVAEVRHSLVGPARHATSSLNQDTVHTTPAGVASERITITIGSAAAAFAHVRPRLGRSRSASTDVHRYGSSTLR
jgi:hypothetical protein